MKMYFLVLRSLSPIQQGIQAGHCAVEYMRQYYPESSECIDWADNHKTFIILNGGSTDELSRHIDYLKAINHRYVTFREPDLGGITTCVCFLAKEDVSVFDLTRSLKLA